MKYDCPDLLAPIFLLGMPRSGTTWLSQILESSPDILVRLSPNFSHALKNKLSPLSTMAEWRDVLRAVCRTDDPFLTLDILRDTGELIRFPDAGSRVATHLVLKDTRFHAVYRAGMRRMPKARTIYIVRHPAAVLWSWKSCREFPVGADFKTEWRSGACRKKGSEGEYWGFEDWKNLTLSYCELAASHPDRYRIVRYEDVVDRAMQEIETIFSFMGIPLPGHTLDFIETTHSRHDDRPYSIFKSKSVAHAWRGHFPADILSQISAEVKGTCLERFVA
jgi:hypothetical protein